MAAAFLGSISATGSNGGTTGSLDTSGATGIYFNISFKQGSSPVPSDSKGNIWTLRGSSSSTFGGGNDVTNNLYYCENPTVGSGHTFTVSGSSIFAFFAALAFSGTATSSSFDVENGASNSLPIDATGQPGSVTPSANGEVLIAGIVVDRNGIVSIDSGFTTAESAATTGGSNFGGAVAYLIETTATAQNPTWGFTTTALWAARIATFKAAAAGDTLFAQSVM